MLLCQLLPGARADGDDLLAWLDGRIARWWMPDDVLFVDAMPLGATGKIDKKAIRAGLTSYTPAVRGHTLNALHNKTTGEKTMDPNGIEGLDAHFIGLASPTAPRIQAGGHPCQGIYWTEAGKRPKVAIIATHYNVDFSEHYIAPYFARQGFGFSAGTRGIAGSRINSCWNMRCSTSVWGCAG
jgi:hypothetical protein